MHKNKYSIYTLLLVLCSMTMSCVETVYPELKEQKRLTVEGSILKYAEKRDTPQQIRLTISQGYFNSDAFAVVDKAVVKVTDNMGNTYPYTYRDNGIYQAQFEAELGRTYKLHISYDGQEYEATDSMPAYLTSILSTSITKIEVLPNPASSKKEDDKMKTALVVKFKDSVDTDNYYLYKFYVNGMFISPAFSYAFSPVYFKDQFFNGNQFASNIVYLEPPLHVGDSIYAELYNITKSHFEFGNAISRIAAFRGGGLGDPPKPSITGNVKNLSNPSMPALGFFYAACVSKSARQLVSQ